MIYFSERKTTNLDTGRWQRTMWCSLWPL